MNFKKMLLKRSKLFYTALVLLSALNAVLNAALLTFISASITGKPLPFPSRYGWMIFSGLLLVSFLSNRFFQTNMIKITNEILLDFTVVIFQKLRLATYETFEKLGNERVFMAINDSRALGNIPTIFMTAFNALVTVVCCIGYLFWVSVPGGLAVLAIMAVLLVVYLSRNEKIEKELNQMRDLHNVFYKYVYDLLHGFKEIKMSTRRNHNLYHNFLLRNRVEGARINTHTSVKYLNNELVGNYSWHMVLGLIVFALPGLLGLDGAQLTGLVLTILYLIGPVAILITLIPNYTHLKIATQRLNDFEKRVHDQLRIDTSPDQNGDYYGEFSSIRFENVTYEYFDEKKQRAFVLGPINLEVRRGEVVFVVGGNGSGKSTFVHLLTGLYKPLSGSILVNGRRVTPEEYPYYSNYLSAVFTNNYLFSENYDSFELSELNQELMKLVELVQLEEVLKIGDNRISTQLSKGQQKRLALVYALMENKQVVVLDEWAAEQDPGFRRYFYEYLLPKCRDEGKTVFAVTHDDAYFSIADHVIRFDFGQIVQDEKYETVTRAYDAL